MPGPFLFSGIILVMTTRTNAFERAVAVAAYENWFADHPHVYAAELAALRSLWPRVGSALEVGMGTGLFALPLGIGVGVEPAQGMREAARAKGLGVVAGVAEALPFPDHTFDRILFVTSVCFFDSPARAFDEAYRVLRPSGVVVVGFINKDSELGKKYQLRKDESPFYRQAHFYSGSEMRLFISKAGFGGFQAAETIFEPPMEVGPGELVKEGLGEGGFGVVRCVKLD